MDYHMLRQQGLSIRKIAALRGVSRNAVRRALRSTVPPTGKRKRAKGTTLEAYKPQINSWLTSEVTGMWTAERIFDELRDRGYTGGRTVVKDFVRENRPRKTPPAEARFFVKPGHLVSVDGVRYSVPAEFARRAVTLHLRPTTVTILLDGAVIASHGKAPYGVRLVQLQSHLPPPPKPRHERFAQLGEAIVERYGVIGGRYVTLVEQKAPHAPLAILKEVLDRHDEYGAPTVLGALESLLQFSIVKRGTLSTLCQRFGGTPKIKMTTPTMVPHVDVERRSLSVYNEVAA